MTPFTTLFIIILSLCMVPGVIGIMQALTYLLRITLETKCNKQRRSAQ